MVEQESSQEEASERCCRTLEEREGVGNRKSPVCLKMPHSIIQVFSNLSTSLSSSSTRDE
jgi:hypothetical protein